MKYLAFLLGFLACGTAQAQQVPHPVGGPSTSTINEIALFNNTTGNLLKHGVPAGITGNQTTGSTVDSFQVQFKNQTSSDADAFYIWTCVIQACNGPGAVGNWDHNRIITVVPPGSTTEIQASQSIYFINKTGRPGWPSPAALPAYVGQNIVGICDADGAGCWAGNSIITDKRGQGASPRPGMFMAGWETDFQVNSVNSRIAGFLAGGASSAQPASSNGYSCLYLDGPAAAGTVAKWHTCFASQHGSTVKFADIGTAQASGANINSQDVNMYYRDAGDALQNISYAATPGGIGFSTTGLPITASLVIPAGAVFAAGDLGGLRINNRAAAGGNGTIVGFGIDTGWTEVRLGSTTSSTQIFGTPNLPNVVTGTPNASLCLNAANQVIKKTTAGPCI